MLTASARRRSAPLPNAISAELVRGFGALLRAAQMAGAMEAALDLSTRYANDRVQFGRPIGKFQAIQQQLALLAEEAAAALVAVESAAISRRRGAASAEFALAAAKIRAGEAAGKVAEIAHQVHGAIGFTEEHSLHYLTRRLWSWRDEFGDEAYWAALLGRRIAAAGRRRVVAADHGAVTRICSMSGEPRPMWGRTMSTHHTVSCRPEHCHWGFFDCGAEAGRDRRVGRHGDARLRLGRPRHPAVRSGGSRCSPTIARSIEALTPRLGAHILTGPVAVEGAEPGDVLQIEILSIEPRQNWGYTRIRPLAGTLARGFPDPQDLAQRHRPPARRRDPADRRRRSSWRRFSA